ncbi:MAG: aspartate aminotransferase family protein [Methylococcales symbiont of Iophon sp. n. MRB-2018]|nr:MAG: aspartate aminotransferase family protein [Methylococcales symbiont of Iophon sp. n. MRB-2018]KAF3978943.1 MAG: aspartate aminotransferase family protein [Methylococcales symbiont of Iophon sp. n. MRB-2018]
MSCHIMPTYRRLPVTFDRGEGVWLWDKNNKRYFDALSGISVCNLGHSHPAIHQAICQQSKKLLHTSNLYGVAAQEILATKLINKSGMDNVFFCNSGAEANEAAIKIARLYGHQQNISNPCILVMKQSFHGRTMATLSASGNPKIQEGFAPLLEGFIHIPFDDITAIKQALEQNSNIVAIMLEPVQGEGGVHIPATNYLNQVRQICTDNNLLMMLDEIQTGIGRTGKLFAYQHNAIIPDVCTLAKALANGVPIGACLAKGKAATLLTAGKHGSTFGGNPLACHTACAVLDSLSEASIIEQVEAKGSQICSLLSETLKDNNAVLNIRYKGLMIAIDLAMPCAELVGIAQENGLLINVTNEKTIRLLPPLIITSEHIEFLTGILAKLIQAFTKQ